MKENFALSQCFMKWLLPGVRSIVWMTGLVCTLSFPAFSQCNLSLALGNNGTPCLGSDTLMLSGAGLTTQIIWQYNGSTVSTVTPTNHAAGTTVAGDSTGAFGSTNKLLIQPFDVVLDPSGNMYISDKSNNRIQKWAVGDNHAVTVAGDSTGIAGSSANLLNGPADIFLDSLGNLYIADEGNNRVQKWALGAISGVTVAGDPNGASGTSASLLNSPIGVYVDHTGNVYVSEILNNRVQKWAPGASSGVTIAGDPACSSGNAQNRLSGPAGISLDAAGNLYVADANNNRVQRWLVGASTGSTVAGDPAGSYGFHNNLLWLPYGLFIDASNTMYIADANSNRVQKWPAGATHGSTVAGDSLGAIGSSAVRMHFPTSVFVSGQQIFVADFSNNRIQLWGPSIGTNFVPGSAGNYTTIVTTASGCVDTSNVSMVDPIVTPSVTATASSTTVCSYGLDTFTCIVTNGGSSPTYQWYIDGVPASTNNTYIASAMNDGDSVWVVVGSSAPCVSAPYVRSNVIQVSVPVSITPSVTINSSHATICSFDLDTFTPYINNGGPSPLYQWYKNGNPVTTNEIYMSGGFRDNDSIYAVITNSISCTTNPTASSNTIAVSVITGVTPTITISGSAALVCNMTRDTFSSSTSNEGNSPVYQWYKNGVAVSSNPTYSVSGLNNNDSIWTLLTSNAVCATVNTVKSNVIDLYVPPTVTPTVTASASATFICSNSIDTFSAAIINGGASPSYIWYRNGIAVSTRPIYITTGLHNADSIWVTITGDQPCTVNPIATSQKVRVYFGFTLTPGLSIAHSSRDTLCANIADTLTAVPINGGASPQYEWQKNGNTVSYSPVYVFAPQSGDHITCTMTSDAACATPLTASTATSTFLVNPVPIVSIDISGPYTHVCPGDTIILTGTGGNTYRWSNQATSQTIYATTSNNYTVTAINSYGCGSGSAPVAVNFLTVQTPTISNHGDTLISSSSSYYQWVYNGSDMTNATHQEVIAAHGGQYWVSTIDNNGCKSRSAILTITSTGINDINADSAVKLYPNPNNGAFTLEFSDDIARDISIYDELGRIVYPSETMIHQAQFDLRTMSDGIYYVRIAHDSVVKTIKFSLSR